MGKRIVVSFLCALLAACGSDDSQPQDFSLPPSSPNIVGEDDASLTTPPLAITDQDQDQDQDQESYQEQYPEQRTCKSSQLQSFSRSTKALKDPFKRSYHSLSSSVDGKVLIGGKQIFGKMEKLIPMATRQILFQTWAFHPRSQPAHSLFRGLKRLQRKLWKSGRKGRPVHVWMLINILPWENKTQKLDELFRMKRKYKLANSYIRFHIGIWDTKLFAANHAKSISIDNKIAVITGANTSRKNNFKKSYYDLGFTLEGSVVADLNQQFLWSWSKSIQRTACGADSSFVPGFQDESFNEINCWERTKEKPRRFKRRRSRKSSACLPALVVQSAAKSNPMRSVQNSSINRSILQAIRQARRSINILTPNLNVPIVMKELVRAARRGVYVRVILSKGHEAKKESLPSRGGSNQNSIATLASMIAGTSACSRLSVKWYSANGQRAAYGSEPPTSHAKYMVVDDRLTYIGSSNMDIQSWVNSREIGVIIDNRAVAKKWKAQAFTPVYKRSIRSGLCY